MDHSITKVSVGGACWCCTNHTCSGWKVPFENINPMALLQIVWRTKKRFNADLGKLIWSMHPVHNGIDQDHWDHQQGQAASSFGWMSVRLRVVKCVEIVVNFFLSDCDATTDCIDQMLGYPNKGHCFEAWGVVNGRAKETVQDGPPLKSHANSPKRINSNFVTIVCNNKQINK